MNWLFYLYLNNYFLVILLLVFLLVQLFLGLLLWLLCTLLLNFLSLLFYLFLYGIDWLTLYLILNIFLFSFFWAFFCFPSSSLDDYDDDLMRSYLLFVTLFSCFKSSLSYSFCCAFLLYSAIFSYAALLLLALPSFLFKFKLSSHPSI